MFKIITAQAALLGGTIKQDDLLRLTEWLEWEGQAKYQSLTLIVTSFEGNINVEAIQAMLNTNVHVHIAHIAGSASATIALAGTTRSITAGGEMVFHGLRLGDIDRSQQLEALRIEYMKSIAYTKASPFHVDKVMTADYMAGGNVRLSAEKLREYGFVSSILDLGPDERCWHGNDTAYYYYKEHLKKIGEHFNVGK